MVLVIGGWYPEPKIRFNISHKVGNLIRDTIIKDILEPRGIYNKNDSDFVCMEVTTKKDTKEAYLSEPYLDKKNNFITYNFWLPYEVIEDAENVNEEYLKQFFIVLTEFLRVYNIPTEEILRLKSKVESEVLNNDKYLFEPPDYEVDIDQIIKDLGIE